MNMKKYIPVAITCICILTGTALILYPFISNYLYEHRQEEVIYEYRDDVEHMDNDILAGEYSEAVSYNADLQAKRVVITDPFDPDLIKSSEGVSYSELLNLSGDGLMGYIEIPAISVFLPIYHGTSEHVLNKGVGHLENTSLPVGGEGTHAVLSAHSGLSGKKLFTDLELLETGDVFYIYVLDQVLAYEIDNILIVNPEQTENLHIVSGRDYVTLITCTPYGINSHRLLVRGKRIPYTPEEKEIQEQQVRRTGSPWMRQYMFAVGAGCVLLIIILSAGYLIVRRHNVEKK